jgi:leucyl aminopeptidase
VTTYHLRSASPAKTRSDVVVVAAEQSGKDVRLAAGAEDVAEAYGRKLRPLLSTLGFTGKAGEVVKLPSGGTISSPLLVIVGLGDSPGHVSIRRAAGAAARAINNAS